MGNIFFTLNYERMSIGSEASCISFRRRSCAGVDPDLDETIPYSTVKAKVNTGVGVYTRYAPIKLATLVTEPSRAGRRSDLLSRANLERECYRSANLSLVFFSGFGIVYVLFGQQFAHHISVWRDDRVACLVLHVHVPKSLWERLARLSPRTYCATSLKVTLGRREEGCLRISYGTWPVAFCLAVGWVEKRSPAKSDFCRPAQAPSLQVWLAHNNEYYHVHTDKKIGLRYKKKREYLHSVLSIYIYSAARLVPSEAALTLALIGKFMWVNDNRKGGERMANLSLMFKEIRIRDWPRRRKTTKSRQ